MIISQKILNIRLLVLDVDGVLTNGQLHFNENGESWKTFHVHDGLGIKNLQAKGVTIAIISGRSSAIVTKRMQELGVEQVFQGISDKAHVLREFMTHHQLDSSQVAYMGDDTPDLPAMQLAGLRIAPANAILAVKQLADWVTELKGGEGAVREVCDRIMAIQIEAVVGNAVA